MNLDLRNPEHAYIIGLFQTDGNHYETSRNRGRISIELQYSDIELLYKIEKLFNCNTNIRVRVRNTNFKEEYKSVSLSLYSLSVRTQLKPFIPVGKKSYAIFKPENINEINYWRGVIDGDGSLGFTYHLLILFALYDTVHHLRLCHCYF